MSKKSNYQFFRATVLHIALGLLILLLSACGGGSGDATEPEDSTSKTPKISTVTPDKSSLSFKGSESSSQEVNLSIKYDDESTVSRTLKVSWSSLAQEFKVEDNDKVKYVVELLSDVTDQSKKILKITEPESQKVFEVVVDIEALPALISQLELMAENPSLNVDDSVNLDVKITYNNSDILTSLPEGISCKLQDGDGIVKVTEDCNVQAIAPGIAKVTLIVADGLLAENVELPIFNISVLTPAGSPDPAEPKVVTLSSSLETLEVAAASSATFPAELIRAYSDESKQTVNLQIQWNHESNSFIVANTEGTDFPVNFDKVKNRLTIIDPVSGQSINITIKIKQPDPEPAVQITKLIVKSNKQEYLVGEAVELKVSAEYSNDHVEDDVTSKVACTASVSSATASVNACTVTVQNAGTVEVGAKLLPSQQQEIVPVVEPVSLIFSNPAAKVTAVILNVSNITINSAASTTLTVQLTRSYDSAADNTEELRLVWQYDTKTLSVLDSFNKTLQSSFDLSNFANGSGVLSIIDPESQLPVSVDVTIELNTNTTTIDLLKLDIANDQLESGKTYPVSVLATYSDNQTKQVNDLVKCSVDLSVDPIADEKIFIAQDCSLQAMFPGTYQVNVQLLDENNASAGMQIEPLTVVVNPLNLGSMATSSEFNLNVNVDSPAIAFRLDNAAPGATYKLKLSSNSILGIDKNFEFHTLSEPQPGIGCFNNSMLGKESVACGLKTTDSSIFIYIQEQFQNNLGILNYTISTQLDNDILRSDGKKGDDTAPYNNYETLIVGNSFSGHVSSNAYGINNVSYYKADVSSATNQAGNDYVVTVMFKSSYYSVDSVVVTNDGKDTNTPGEAPTIVNECSFYVDTHYTIIPESNTISCNISNAEKPQNIFIEVYGKDLTAVDGEVGYDIIITQP